MSGHQYQNAWKANSNNSSSPRLYVANRKWSAAYLFAQGKHLEVALPLGNRSTQDFIQRVKQLPEAASFLYTLVARRIMHKICRAKKQDGTQKMYPMITSPVKSNYSVTIRELLMAKC